MRQVPHETFLLIGDGRLANHLGNYLNLLKLPFVQWCRKQPISDLDQLQSGVSHILLAIKDDAIEKFVESHPELLKKTVVHFSGSLVSDRVYGAHPLMTFGKTLYDLPTYERIPFIFEKDRKSFAELLPGFKNPSFSICRELKPLYHALCVMGGNFTTILWQKLFEEFEATLGLPSSVALPYLEQIAKNLKDNPKVSLTGPLARRDLVTIETNLRALSEDPFKKIYESFVEVKLKENAI